MVLNFTTGGWTTVTGTAPGHRFFTASSAAQTLGTGTYYYTIGTSTAYPNTRYSYQTGNWANPDIWTLEPVTTLVNPLHNPLKQAMKWLLLMGLLLRLILTIWRGSTTIQAGGIWIWTIPLLYVGRHNRWWFVAHSRNGITLGCLCQLCCIPVVRLNITIQAEHFQRHKQPITTFVYKRL